MTSKRVGLFLGERLFLAERLLLGELDYYLQRESDLAGEEGAVEGARSVEGTGSLRLRLKPKWLELASTSDNF